MEGFMVFVIVVVITGILGYPLTFFATFPFGGDEPGGAAIAYGFLLAFVIAICIISFMADADYTCKAGFVFMYIGMGAMLVTSILGFIFTQDPLLTYFWIMMPVVYFLWRYVCVSIRERDVLDVSQMIFLLIGALILTGLIEAGLGYLVSTFPEVMIIVNPIAGAIIFGLAIFLIVKENERSEYYNY